MDRARFLLAQLHLDSLRDKTSSKMVKKALNMLPKGSKALDLAYHGAMQRVEDQLEDERFIAKQLLGWLTYSERLMTVEEVQHALAIEPGTSDFDEDNLGDVDEILGFCAGLVIIDEETQIIRLVHYTTQEYFKRNGDRILASAQQDIAVSCLTYLLYETFEDGWFYGSEQKEDSKRNKIAKRLRYWHVSIDECRCQAQTYPFLEYAAWYWAAHVRVCEQQNVKELMMVLCKDDRKVSSAGQVVMLVMAEDYNEYYSQFKSISATKSGSPLSAMHVIAYLGYEELISELLNHGFEADAKDSTHRTPLWWAAMQGHEAVVSLLLSRSHVNVNNRCLIYINDNDRVSCETPLNIAALFGKHQIVKLLIQREDVDVNLPDGFGESPLSRAVKLGYSTIVELLLMRRDIEVNSRDRNGNTPLLHAAKSGQQSVVRQLLEQKDIQLNSVDSYGLSPLALAASAGYEDIVEALLCHSDIDVNTKDIAGRTPLWKAVLHGHGAIVELLLSHTNVEVNLKDVRDQAALRIAAQSGDVSIVKLLLRCVNIDVNSKDIKGRTPLHEAARRGDEEIVTMLLGHLGIEISPKDQTGKTPLAYAIINHRAAAIKVFQSERNAWKFYAQPSRYARKNRPQDSESTPS